MSYTVRSNQLSAPRSSGDAGLGRRFILGTFVALALGCASTPSSAPGGSAPRRAESAAEYYPLEPGWKWAYDLERNGEHMLAVYQVLERIPDGAIVQAGDERISYAVTPQGVAQREGSTVGDFVLKNPIAAGAEWPVFGGTAKVVAMNQKVGDYADCVVVETLRRDPNRLSRTTFARGIGPVAIEVQVESEGRYLTTVRASLRGATKPGQDPLALDTR